MFWCSKILEDINGPQLINDSKTPSGRVHVGSLRGVLIHDAIFRTLKERGIPVRYLFGVDDYDPLDEIPAGEAEHFEQYLGQPLCNVPPPKGSASTDMAEHYIGEFFDIFRELDVHAETYRMRDVYRSGQLNPIIDIILNHHETVRNIYLNVSKSKRPDNWYPFQVICENCRRIGTTTVYNYDGKYVDYRCEPDLVTWATGCGHEGRVSPFDGNGKLPWKLEWVAKWKLFSITIEGAGKDHSTKGGSRDVAARCLKEIFGIKAPLNIPYEFFLVEGAKMSSSRGLGATARDMADFLPPEILRFLMLRTQPQRPVNFDANENYIIKLFNEFDRYHGRAQQDESSADDDRRIHSLSEVFETGNYYTANFQLVATLAQMPHLDLVREIEKYKGAALTAVERAKLDRRRMSALYWLENFASDEEKTEVQDVLPDGAQDLTSSQKAFLNTLADALQDIPWNSDAIQSAIFRVARMIPIRQPAAFQAIYRTIFNRRSGPKAGNVLSVLTADFVINRLHEVSYEIRDLWLETGLSAPDFEANLTTSKAKITGGRVQIEYCHDEEMGAIVFMFEYDDQKVHLFRVLVTECDDVEIADQDSFVAFARTYITEVVRNHGLPDLVIDPPQAPQRS